MKISEIKLRRFEAILTPLSSKITVVSVTLYLNSKTTAVILLDKGVKMASKRRSFISLIFIINYYYYYYYNYYYYNYYYYHYYYVKLLMLV